MNIKKNIYFWFLIIIPFISAFSQKVDVGINFKKQISKVNPLLFGMNMARWDESLFPGPAKDMLLSCDRDAIKKIIGAKFALLKYPGGNDADSYIWNSPNNNESEMNTDEYSALLKAAGSVGFITINFNQPPELAAEWVRYCNIKNDYNIKLWEVGDEQWGSWAKGHTSPEGYAEKYIKFVKAMKAVDPTIQVSMNVTMDDKPDGWTVRSLKAAKEYVDLVTITYFPITNKQEDDERLILSTPRDFIEPYKSVRRAIQSVFSKPKGDTMWIIPVGYNTVSGYPGPVTLSILNGIWVSDMLGVMADLGVESACYWAFHNAYPPRGGDYGVLSPDSMNTPSYNYYAMKLMSSHLKNNMLECKSSDTLLSVYSSKDKDGNKVSVILINKSKEQSKLVKIKFDNFEPKEKVKTWLLSETQKYSQNNDLIWKNERDQIHVQPYSVMVLEFENKDYIPDAENLSLNSIASASSYSLTGPNFKPQCAIDGIKYTRWASAAWASRDAGDPQWFKLDFIKSRTFNNIKISWDNGFAVVYDVLISNDGNNWEKIYSQEKGIGNIEVISFKPVAARYLKIDMKKGSKAISTYNIEEIEVYNK
jgi:alpha-L-arabinofuranosidase